MTFFRRFLKLVALSSVAVLLLALNGFADAVIDWNLTANQIVADQHPGLANRALAMVQSAVYVAVNSITRKYTTNLIVPDAPSDASLDAAVAAVNYAMLSGLFPSKKEAIEKAYNEALAKIKDDASKKAGIDIGEKAVAAVITARADDIISETENYRPRTSPGVYIPTTIPVASSFPQRKPWNLTSPDQFRPGPPPDLKSDIWARDYNEIRAVGSSQSTVRTKEQTDIARFWQATTPAVYFPLVREIADIPGRDITRNARLFAAAGQAMDDAIIAVFDAKYHYNFWRPLTAIRNGDIDGNDATEREPSWQPFIETPMHPEYPCAHCIVSSALGELLRSELAGSPVPTLRSTSPTLPGVTRTWNSLDDFMKEVANARVYDGVHFRNSTEVGSAMGAKIGRLTAEKMLR